MALGEAMKDITVSEEEAKEYYKANEISLWLEKQFMRSIFL